MISSHPEFRTASMTAALLCRDGVQSIMQPWTCLCKIPPSEYPLPPFPLSFQVLYALVESPTPFAVSQVTPTCPSRRPPSDASCRPHTSPASLDAAWRPTPSSTSHPSSRPAARGPQCSGSDQPGWAARIGPPMPPAAGWTPPSQSLRAGQVVGQRTLLGREAHSCPSGVRLCRPKRSPPKRPWSS